MVVIQGVGVNISDGAPVFVPRSGLKNVMLMLTGVHFFSSSSVLLLLLLFVVGRNKNRDPFKHTFKFF